MRNFGLVISLTYFFLSIAGAHSVAGQVPDHTNDIDQIVFDVMRKQQIPAATVAVARNGRVIYSKAFGTADIENNVPATSETLIRTSSLAKPISATAAMTLVEAGKLDLDAPVQKYCPAFPQKPWAVTTRELLTHTSGIRHYKPHEEESTRHFRNTAEALQLFANDPLLFKPGTKYSYSTYGYTLLTCVIEGASGEHFFDYLREHVLVPAGMTHTFVDDVYEIMPHRARGYHVVSGHIHNSALSDSSYKIAGGGLLSTAEDLVRFAVALTNGRIVNRQTLVTMLAPTKLPSGAVSSHGLGGFSVRTINGLTHLAHDGGEQGSSTDIDVVPAKGFAVSVFVNDEDAEPFDIIRPILEMYGVSRSVK